MTAKEKFNEYIDTHPTFMSTWPLRNREAMRRICDVPQLEEFFTQFLEWYKDRVLEEDENNRNSGPNPFCK